MKHYIVGNFPYEFVTLFPGTSASEQLALPPHEIEKRLHQLPDLVYTNNPFMMGNASFDEARLSVWHRGKLISFEHHPAYDYWKNNMTVVEFWQYAGCTWMEEWAHPQ